MERRHFVLRMIIPLIGTLVFEWFVLAVSRSLCLLYLLLLIVHCWPVPERLRRSVCWHVHVVPGRKLQRLIRQAPSDVLGCFFSFTNG